MSDRRPSVGGRGQHRGAGARPFGPGEAPLGVRPGLGGGRRRAGVTPIGSPLARPSSIGQGATRGRDGRLSPGAATRLRSLALGALLVSALLLPPVAARANLATVSHITVAGASLLDPAAVITAAHIAIGSSLLGADLRAAEQAVAALPLVASVRVTAGLPDTVQIRVREKALLLRWQIGDQVYAVSESGEILGSIDELHLAPSATSALADTPILFDDRVPSPLRTGSQLTSIELDAVTRLASLTPADLGTAAPSINLRLVSDFGFVIEAVGPTVAWTAVFGIYSVTIRPTSMIPGQVRLLRSLLAGRETRIGWVILADDQAGTYTDKGVRPPPPSAAPSPSASPTEPAASPSAPVGSP